MSGLSAKVIGQLMSRHRPVVGEATGTLRIEIPTSFTHPGNPISPMHRKRSTTETMTRFEDVPGDWRRHADDNTEGLGRDPFSEGECVLNHARHGMDHAEIAALLNLDGIQVFWDDVRLSLVPGGLVEDKLAGATVVRFARA